MNRTVARTFEILKLVANSEHGISLQQIAQAMDMPKSSAFVIVHSLLELGYIKTVENNNKLYCLGIEIFTLGMKYSDKRDIVQLCGEHLPAIAEKYNKTAFLGMLNGTDIVYLYKYVAKNARLATCSIGSSKPAHATALGKCMLAYLPQEKLMAKLDQITFHTYTKNTISSKEQLLDEITRIRLQGYASEQAELSSLTSCYSVPVLDRSGTAIAAISLSDIVDSGTPYEQMVQDLKAVALEISHAISYLPR